MRGERKDWGRNIIEHQEVEVADINRGDKQKRQDEAMHEDEGEEMELGDLDLDEIEKECDKAG